VVCTTITNQYTTYTTCNTVPATGTLTLSIGSFTSSATYSSNIAEGSLAATLAANRSPRSRPDTRHVAPLASRRGTGRAPRVHR
jgi:hypothetical protein